MSDSDMVGAAESICGRCETICAPDDLLVLCDACLCRMRDTAENYARRQERDACVGFVLSRAAECFKAGDDDRAKLLRDLAKDLEATRE